MHGPLEFSKTIQNSSACYIEQYKLPKKFYGLYLAQPNSITLTERDFFYNLIQHNNKNVFFVCSEKLLAEKDFATLPNVFIRPKSWWINTDAHRTAMHDVDAAIDLHILSRSEILNTNKSSAFLQLAVILAGHNNYVRDAVLPELRLGLKVVDFTSTPQ